MKKILIIDDELKLRETLSDFFSLLNYVVLEAKNGIEGLEKAKENIPHLIICDVNMPFLNGYEFLAEHQKSNFSNIPVILLSAKTESENQRKGIELGAKAYVTKPFAIKELKKIVDFCLNPLSK